MKIFYGCIHDLYISNISYNIILIINFLKNINPEVNFCKKFNKKELVVNNI